MKANITKSAVKGWKRQQVSKPVDVYCSTVGGFVARVRPSGTVTYFLKYESPSGKSRHFTIGRDCIGGMDAKSARSEALRLKQLVREGCDLQKEKVKAIAEKRANSEKTLGVFINERYVPHYLQKRTKRGAEEAERMLRANFSHLFDEPMSDITPEDIEVWQTAKEAQGRQSDTIKRIRGELESVYSHAMREPLANWKWLRENPLAELIPIPAKPVEELKPRFLSEEETRRLIKALRQRDLDVRRKIRLGAEWRDSVGYVLKCDLPAHFVDHLEVMVIVSLKTGLRRNELFSLEWTDISKDFGEISVRASISKTKTARIIPLAKVAREHLVKWRAQSTSNTYVFPSIDGRKFKDVKKSWKNLLKRANIDNFRWHDMRHDFASQLVIRNVSIEKVSKLLGHKNIKTTQRYAHLNNECLAEAVEVLN